MREKSDKSYNRRSFLRQLSLILAAVAGFFVLISLLRQFIPPLSRSGKRIKLGKIGSFPLNTYTYIPDHKIFIYRDHSGIKAISAICTHLGCTVEKVDNGFQCPCHGSFFNERGKILSGAATKDLIWYRLFRSVDGQIVVDFARTVDADYKL